MSFYRSINRSINQTIKCTRSFHRRFSNNARSINQNSRAKLLAGAVSATVAATALAYQSQSFNQSLECAASTAQSTPQSPPQVKESSRLVRSFIGDVVGIPLEKTINLSFEELSKMFQFQSTDSEQKVDSINFTYPLYGSHQAPLTFTNQSTVPINQSMELMLRSVQDSICQHILNIESSSSRLPESINQSEKILQNNRTLDDQSMCFREDVTLRPDGGGIARVIQGGLVFEKAGVSVSVANVKLPFHRLSMMADDHADIAQILAINEFNRKQAVKTGDQSITVIDPNTIVERFTASLSLVIHPANPMVPTSHANFRYFCFQLPNNQSISWFAGGTDLTPAYVNDADSSYFHSTLKRVCDRHDATYYPRFKAWCDRYFKIEHRNETRGVGGIFFDDINAKTEQSNGRDVNLSTQQAHSKYLSFLTDCAQNFSQAYFPLVVKRAATPYTRAEKEWQLYRRSRYVEFNLMYDKGTSFGLSQANARPEAILMSLPLNCSFQYKPNMVKGSEEERTINILKTPVEWV